MNSSHSSAVCVYRLIGEVIGKEWLPVFLRLIMADNGLSIANLRDIFSVWVATARC